VQSNCHLKVQTRKTTVAQPFKTAKETLGDHRVKQLAHEHMQCTIFSTGACQMEIQPAKQSTSQFCRAMEGQFWCENDSTAETMASVFMTKAFSSTHIGCVSGQPCLIAFMLQNGREKM